MAFSPPEVSSTMPNAIISQNSIDNPHSTDDHIVTNTDIQGGSGDGETGGSADGETGGSADGETGGSADGETGGAEDDLHFQPKKRQKTSKVWLEFNVIDAVNKAECKHCKSRLSILKSKSTTHLSRHLACCLKRKLNQKQQQKISLEPINENSVSMASIALTDGKFEVYRIKVLLDKIHGDETEEPFIHDMVDAMKTKFDKYWGECNLLMAIAAILDPRCKMTVIEYCFPKMYSKEEAREKIKKVRDALYELYDEYVADMYSDISTQSEQIIDNTNRRSGVQEASGWSEFIQHVKSAQTSKPQQSELSNYLEEGCHICEDISTPFDALEWWRTSALKYRILSKMARDILAIPISTVASEATFSAGGRVIDTYRASLNADTVQTLICGGDWCRSLHGVKRKNKSEKKPLEIMLPIS